uniref:Serine/threonine/tyrosine interacting protein n=1 Tax=Taeniopygia guttata TaxID=59729 RepID=A0A674HIV3_TAEGU
MTKEFIDGSLQSGGKVLVHGNAGISRSAALVIAYIMETFGVKYRDAFTYVQERRFCINPNAGFVHQLQEYEAIYLAKLTIQMMSPLQLERSLSVPPGSTGEKLLLMGGGVRGLLSKPLAADPKLLGRVFGVQAEFKPQCEVFKCPGLPWLKFPLASCRKFEEDARGG